MHTSLSIYVHVHVEHAYLKCNMDWDSFDRRGMLYTMRQSTGSEVVKYAHLVLEMASTETY